MDNIDDIEKRIDDEEENENRDIEVITGNGKDLDISPVYSHVKIDKPDVNRDKNRRIIIPNSKEENEDEEENNETSDENK